MRSRRRTASRASFCSTTSTCTRARTSRATSVASPPVSTRSSSARRRSSARSVTPSSPARAAGTVGPGLTLLFRTAISAGRRARSETAIGANPATASSMALALAEGALGDLREKHVLVVGAGRIGLQTLKAAEGRGIAQRRRREPDEGARGRGRRERFGATAHDLDELEAALAAADVVVTATVVRGARRRAPTSCARRWRRARERPLVVVDLAVPADVEREAGEVAGVRLFDVDDLRAGLDDAMASRLREVPKVEAIVEERGRGLRPPLPRARGRAAPLRAAQAGGVDPRARARARAERPRRRRSGRRRADGAPVADAREAAPARPDGARARASRRG